jgi:transcriptional regulator with XRE-family HTH domain
MADPPWAENLRYLCGFYPSISEVCRRLEINRQQFNKYLSGQVRPSRHNRRRLADFFGVQPDDLDLPPRRFAELASAPGRAPEAAQGRAGPLRAYARLLERSRGGLDRYLGYYLRIAYACSYPGYVIVSLAAIGRQGDAYTWKTVEAIRPPRPGAPATVMKYAGTALLLGDRIYVIEHEALLGSSITQLILYPSYENPITVMTGIQTGAPTVRGRKPTAGKVLLQYLGRAPDLRATLRTCGIFEADSERLDPAIRTRVHDHLGDGGDVLEVDEL